MSSGGVGTGDEQTGVTSAVITAVRGGKIACRWNGAARDAQGSNETDPVGVDVGGVGGFEPPNDRLVTGTLAPLSATFRQNTFRPFQNHLLRADQLGQQFRVRLEPVLNSVLAHH